MGAGGGLNTLSYPFLTLGRLLLAKGHTWNVLQGGTMLYKLPSTAIMVTCSWLKGLLRRLVARAHICHEYHELYSWRKTAMWRNFSFLYRIWTIYGVLSKFMPFLFKIYVEKNLCGENLCEGRMTNISLPIMQLFFLTLFKTPLRHRSEETKSNIP